jgi:hypothetical protein
MYQNVHVTDVEVVGTHRLVLRFEDGAEGEVDFSGFPWRGIFEPLRDPDYFRLVHVDPDGGTIAWPHGADVAHDTMHVAVTQRSTPRWV